MSTGPAPAQAPDRSGPVLFLLGLVMAGFLVVVWGVGRVDEEPPPPVEPPSFQHDRERDRDREGDRGRREGRGARDGQQAAAGEPAAWDRNVP